MAPTRRIGVREHIFCEGDPCTHVFHVDSGVVAIYRPLIDGRRHIIDFAFPGDLIGLSTTAHHVFNAQAVSAVRLRCLSARVLEREAHSDINLALRLYRGVCQELAATREQLVIVAQADATEKVARFLVELYRRIGQPDQKIMLDMGRQDIADYLGLTMETVSRTFSKLRIMGIIELPVKSTVHIRDLGHLQELALN